MISSPRPFDTNKKILFFDTNNYGRFFLIQIIIIPQNTESFIKYLIQIKYGDENEEKMVSTSDRKKESG